MGNIASLVVDSEKSLEEIKKDSPDAKEMLEFGTPYDMGHADIAPTPWLPEDVSPRFRKFVEEWWGPMHTYKQLLSSLCEILQISLDRLLKTHILDDSHMAVN